LIEPLDVLRAYPRHDYTLPGFLESRIGAGSEREFLVFEGRSWSYGEIGRAAERMAAYLAARGVAAGDRIGVISANHPSTVALFFALARLGAIMVPTNPDFGPEEAGYVFDHAGVSGIIAAPNTLKVAQTVRAGLKTEPWLILNEPGADGLPVLDDEVAALPADAPVPDSVASPESTCLIVYTSGTTGFPKGAMHGQKGVILAGEGFVNRMYLQPDDRLMCVLPMFHINALIYSLCGAVAAGAVLVPQRRFSASAFWKVVAENGITEVNLIAAAASFLVNRPRSEFVPGHKMKKVFSAPLTEQVVRVFRDEFEVPVMIECYGMTEIPGVLANPFKGPRKLGAMGKISPHPDPAIPRAEMRVVDEEGNDVPVGTPGELVVRTPMIMQGYYRAPDLTAAAFRDGWFLTGDIGYRDADDFFYYVARKKDIIRVRGENVAGAELDRVISEHPEVEEAAVIGVPSEYGDEEILAAVVPKACAAPDAGAIAEWTRRHLAEIKMPRYVVFVEELPHTPTHRIAKHKLKEDKTLLARAVDLSRGGRPQEQREKSKREMLS
jgi:crotonobetaine/carnitine-CoA ligase